VPPPATTRLSTKGQMILPKEIRERRKWGPGTSLTLIERPDGILIREAAAEPVFKPTRPEDIAGSLNRYVKGRTISLEEMDQAITDEVKARHARGRY
jgi:AbrB family looped-hinge helix DNA binding protein